LFGEAGVVFFDRFFQSGLVKWIKAGVPFKNVIFQNVPRAEPRFRYPIGEMFTQVFQDSRLLAQGSGRRRSAIGFIDLPVVLASVVGMLAESAHHEGEGS